MKEYISSCETTFRLSKSNYPDDATKVLYASQFLTGETKRAWLRLKQTKGKDNITWDEYTEWLWDQLQNPVTRASTLARKYDEAAQRPNQTVIQFVNYLDDLEAELPPYLDEHRRQHLLAKLSPEIRHALNNYQHIPETRTGLINLAIQLEGNMSSWSKPAGEPREGHKSNRDDKGKGKVKSHGQSKSKENISGSHPKAGHAQKPTSTRKFPKLSDEEYERRKKEGLCFICGKPGHDSKMCRFNPDHASQNDSKSKNLKSQ